MRMAYLLPSGLPAPQVDPKQWANMAIEARENEVRHAPLWVVREMAKQPKHKGLVAETLSRVIQRRMS